MRTKERLDQDTQLDMTKKYEELRHMYQKYNY